MCKEAEGKGHFYFLGSFCGFLGVVTPSKKALLLLKLGTIASQDMGEREKMAGRPRLFGRRRRIDAWAPVTVFFFAVFSFVLSLNLPSGARSPVENNRTFRKLFTGRTPVHPPPPAVSPHGKLLRQLETQQHVENARFVRLAARFSKNSFHFS